MNKAIHEDEMSTEIDFSGGERVRFVRRAGDGVWMVTLEPDLTEFFPDSEAVNAALRLVLRAGIVAAGQAVQERRRSK